jgi:hypothetical protein
VSSEPAVVRKPARCSRPSTKEGAKAAHKAKMARKKELNAALGPGFYPAHLWERLA